MTAAKIMPPLGWFPSEADFNSSDDGAKEDEFEEGEEEEEEEEEEGEGALNISSFQSDGSPSSVGPKAK